MASGPDRSRYLSLLSDPPMVAILGLVLAGVAGLQAVPPSLPATATALGVPDERVGWVLTAFFLPAGVALPVAGALADRYGRRRVILPSLVVFGGAGVATALVDTFEVLLALRVLQGLAFPGVIPLSVTLVGDLYSGPRGSMAQGFRISVNGVGSTVVPALAGLLAATAWNLPYLLFAAAFPVLAVVYVALPETRAIPEESEETHDGPDGEPDDTDLGGGPGDAANADGDDDREDLAGYVRSVAVELRDPDLLVLVAGAFVVFFVAYAVVTFVPLLAVRELGASDFAAGVLISVIGASRILVPLLSGPAVARFSRRVALVASLVATTAGVLATALAWNLLALGVAVAVYGAGFAMFVPVLNDAVVGMTSTERRASVVNVLELAKTTALGASPAFFGVVLGIGGFVGVFALAGSIVGAYSLLAAVLVDPATARHTPSPPG